MREYGIDLSFSINSISWRKFLLLLNGLTENSITVQTVKNRKSGKTAIRTNKAQEKTILKEFF